MKRRTALVGSLATLAAATSAKADTPVDLQLVLAVDVSRSIDEVEAELQRRGYIEALTNDRVIDAILSGEHRRIALCYTEWAGTHYQVVVIDWTVIDSAGSRAPLRRQARRGAAHVAELDRGRRRARPRRASASRTRASPPSGASSTSRATAAPTTGRRPSWCATGWSTQGIVINGLPVMMNRTNFGRPPDPTLDKYYEENVIGGPGSFMIVGRQLRRFRPRRAHQAGPRDFLDRFHGSASTRLSRSNGAVSRVSWTGMPRWPSG